MKKAIEFFVNRSLLVNLVSVLVLVVGVLSTITLKKDTFPSVDFDVIIINTIYPGTTPEDIEKFVTIELERKLKEVDGIEELNALSLEGKSILSLKIDPDYDGDEVLTDVKDAVDSVTDLPEEVETPIVRMLKNTHRSILRVALTGPDEIATRRMAKDLRDEIEFVPGVAKIELSGFRAEEIVVEVFLEKLNEYQITVDEVVQAIRGRNMSLSGGVLKTGTEELLIRTKGEFKDLSDIKNVVIRSNNTGLNVKVSQIGKVSRGLNTSSVLHRAQNDNAIYLNVKKKYSADVIKVTDRVKQTLEKFFSSRKNGDVSYIIVDELAYYVKRRLGILTSNGLLGLFLVVGVLLLFLNFRVSAVTALGAPIAFLTAFALMDVAGISINLISMFGLILVLGMLVDDAIIVAEHFYQHVEEGVPPKQAAIIAANETVRPVTATILTTILAFGSIFFMGGIMGKFLWPVPAVVIICLIASWLECFFVLPSHLADFVKPEKPSQKKRRWYEPLRETYMKVLNRCVRYPFLTFFIFIATLIAAIALAKTMRFELFPGDDVREVIVNIKGKIGDPLEKTERTIIKAEKILDGILQEEELRAIRGIVGSQMKRQNRRTGSHYGAFILYLTDPSQRDRSTDEIITEVSKKLEQGLPNYEIASEKLAGGPPRGRPIDIQLKSNSLEDLKAASLKIISQLKKAPGIINTERDFEEGKTQLIIVVDEVEAKRLGLSTTHVAQAVRRAFSDNAITKVRDSDEDVEIILKLDKESRSQVDTLKKLYLLNNQGRRIQLSRVAKVEEDTGSFLIRRLDRKRTISVFADIDKKLTTPVAAARQLRPQVEKVVATYPGMGINMGGENKDTQESMVRLAKAALISLGAIFLVLVTMFGSFGQSLIIISAIPLGFIGVVITFKVLGLSLGFMAMMGMIGLVGVVVNDSIVLVNFINKKRSSEKGVVDAILEAAKSRFRPVVLTSFTTVASLLPIAHGTSGDPFLKPMAISFAWGLVFSTLVTLLFIPCAYLIYERSLKFLSHLLKRTA